MEEAYQFYIEWGIAMVLGYVIAAIDRRSETRHICKKKKNGSK